LAWRQAWAREHGIAWGGLARRQAGACGGELGWIGAAAGGRCARARVSGGFGVVAGIRAMDLMGGWWKGMESPQHEAASFFHSRF